MELSRTIGNAVLDGSITNSVYASIAKVVTQPQGEGKTDKSRDLMTSLLDAFQGQTDSAGMPGVWHLVSYLVVSFILALFIGKVYQHTHRGISYSQSNVQTYVLVCVVVTVIMIIVGTNFARAFTMLGALSIVRFRNAVKESRDIGFMFWAMAVGMASGTGFLNYAAITTVTIAVFVYVMHYFSFFARTVRERILLVEADAEADHNLMLGEFFESSFQDHYLISMESLPGNTTVQLVYSVTVPGKFNSGKFLGALRKLTGDKKVSIIEGQQQMDL